MSNLAYKHVDARIQDDETGKVIGRVHRVLDLPSDLIAGILLDYGARHAADAFRDYLDKQTYELERSGA